MKGKIYYFDNDYHLKLLHADTFKVLSAFKSESVDMIFARSSLLLEQRRYHL